MPPIAPLRTPIIKLPFRGASSREIQLEPNPQWRKYQRGQRGKVSHLGARSPLPRRQKLKLGAGREGKSQVYGEGREAFGFGLSRCPFQGCQMAKFDPFISLNCARVEGGGTRKGRDQILKHSVAEPWSLQPEGLNSCNLNIWLSPSGNHGPFLLFRERPIIISLLLSVKVLYGPSFGRSPSPAAALTPGTNY